MPVSLLRICLTLLTLLQLLSVMPARAGESTPVMTGLTGNGEAGAGENTEDPKTLTRRHDPLVVSGDLLPVFDNVPIENLRLLAHDGRSLKVIPFQVDERDPEGEFIFTKGPAAGRDEDKGRFDYNDEIVFLAQDTGAKALPDEWAGLGDMGAEIVINDPQDPSRKGWVYLIHFPQHPPPLSTTDYVHYSPGREIVRSDYYTLKYKPGAPFYMDIICPESAGGNGQDFFDRVKVRLSVDAFFHLLHIQKTEEDFKSRVMGWKDGPVRVLRRVENYFRILFNLSSPSIFSVNEYYQRLTYTPVQITIPFRLKWVFNTFAVNDWTWRIYGDFPGLKGGLAYTDRNLDGFHFTGHHSAEEIAKNVDLSRFKWGYNTRAGVGTWFPNLLMPEMLYGVLALYVVDDENQPDQPDDIPGLIGGGMKGQLKDFNPDLMNKLDPGTYELSLDTYFPNPGMGIAEVEEWLQIRNVPLQVEIGAVRLKTEAGKDRRNQGSKSVEPPSSADKNRGFSGLLTDTRGRELRLHDLYFYAGSFRVTPRTTILGRLFTKDKYLLLNFKDIRRLEHRFEKTDPISEMKNPMVQSLTMQNGKTIELLGCKPCGFSGRLPDGKKVFLWDTQIRSLAFVPE